MLPVLIPQLERLGTVHGVADYDDLPGTRRQTRSCATFPSRRRQSLRAAPRCWPCDLLRGLCSWPVRGSVGLLGFCIGTQSLKYVAAWPGMVSMSMGSLCMAVLKTGCRHPCRQSRCQCWRCFLTWAVWLSARLDGRGVFSAAHCGIVQCPARISVAFGYAVATLVLAHGHVAGHGDSFSRLVNRARAIRRACRKLAVPPDRRLFPCPRPSATLKAPRVAVGHESVFRRPAPAGPPQ